MINRTIEQIYYKDDGADRREAAGDRRAHRQGLSPTFRSGCDEGEIVGLYGLIGAGRSEFVQSVFGRHPATAGRVLWQGKPVAIRNEQQAMGLGIALAPESRRDQGLCLNLGVGLNINLPIFERLTHGLIISRSAEADAPTGRSATCGSSTPSRAAPVAQPLRRQPAEGRDRQVAQPRRQAVHLRRADGRRRRRHQGGDLSAARRAAARGAGIIMISSYLPEVYELADTLHVFRRGRLVGEHGHKDASHETILTEAIGV